MAPVNERDPCEFVKYPTVAVHVEHEDCVKTFYLHCSLLDKYTNLVEDVVMTGREAIDIEADVETFSDFVKWLYRGPEVIKTYECHDLEEPFSRLWQLACRLEAEELKNQVVDYLQSLPFDEDFIGVLRRMWDIADSKAHAYMCEKVVYEIVDKGWADFIQATGRAWEFLMRDRQSCPLIERIKERLGDAYYNRSNGELMDPKTRMDCQWHEHTEKTRSECPRYQPEVRPTNVLKTEA